MLSKDTLIYFDDFANRWFIIYKIKCLLLTLLFLLTLLTETNIKNIIHDPIDYADSTAKETSSGSDGINPVDGKTIVQFEMVLNNFIQEITFHAWRM